MALRIGCFAEAGIYAAVGISSACLWLTGEVLTDVRVVKDEVVRLSKIVEERELRLEEKRSLPPQQDVKVDAPPKEQLGEELPVGLKNNNPANVKGVGWHGQIGVDKKGHAIFQSPEYGLRAAAMTLKNYQEKHGLRTVEQIVSRYSKSGGAAYAAYLAGQLGVAVDEQIDVLIFREVW